MADSTSFQALSGGGVQDSSSVQDLSVHAASLADRLSFRISAFRLSVVADSTSVHALSSTSVQVFSFQDLSVQDLSGGR